MPQVQISLHLIDDNPWNTELVVGFCTVNNKDINYLMLRWITLHCIYQICFVATENNENTDLFNKKPDKQTAVFIKNIVAGINV